MLSCERGRDQPHPYDKRASRKLGRENCSADDAPWGQPPIVTCMTGIVNSGLQHLDPLGNFA